MPDVGTTWHEGGPSVGHDTNVLWCFIVFFIILTGSVLLQHRAGTRTHPHSENKDLHSLSWLCAPAPFPRAEDPKNFIYLQTVFMASASPLHTQSY